MMKEPEFLIYGHHDSGHSYKVCLFLTLAGLRYRYVSVDVFAPLSQRSREFREISRYGEVPILVHRELRISQSNAILLYLASQTGRFGGADIKSSVSITEWLFWEMSRLNLGVANLRFALRFETDPTPDVVSLFRGRAEGALSQLDAQLQRSQYIVGQTPTIADLSCAGYLFWADQAGLDLARYPQVSRWLADIQRLDGWRPPEELLREDSLREDVRKAS
jgi:glutathione S-transferase